MARRSFFNTSGGDTVIPVADGQFFTDQLRIGQDTNDIYLAFYSDAAATTPATPTAGTLTFAGEYQSGFFLTPSGGAVINADQVKPEATYTPVIIDGAMIRARMTLAGITGAAYLKAWVFERGN